jgi:hypothetical protein
MTSRQRKRKSETKPQGGQGFYFEEFKASEAARLGKARGGSVQDEIEFLRVLITRMAERADEDPLKYGKIIGELCGRISTLERTEKKLGGTQDTRGAMLTSLGTAVKELAKIKGEKE